MDCIIEEYTTYQESEVLALYGSVGWTAYTEQPEALRRGFAGSLLTLAARENGTLVGLLRAVGDGCTVVLVQDLLCGRITSGGESARADAAALERFRSVRQVQLLTDDTEKTKGFYRSLGLLTLPELGCCGFMRP